MARIELRTVLDRRTLDEILELIEQTTRLEGHRPVGEHKYSHLKVGATGWLGVLARDEADTLVGYAHTRWGAPGQRPRVAVEVVVHPQARGEGEVAIQLLDETRAEVARAGGGLMYLWVHRVGRADQTLAYDLGYAIQRELAFMVRQLDGPPPPVLADGIDLRPYRGEQDDGAFLAVNNAAFEGHPENGGWTTTDFAQRKRLGWFEPDDLLLAWRGNELLGFHWTKWHGHESDEVPAHEPVGEVYVLAVTPAEQGRGLGRGLLDAGVRHLWERGCRQAVLYVDCASTAAVHLYESAGFEHHYRNVCYEQWVDAVVGDSTLELQRPAF